MGLRGFSTRSPIYLPIKKPITTGFTTTKTKIYLDFSGNFVLKYNGKSMIYTRKIISPKTHNKNED